MAATKPTRFFLKPLETVPIYSLLRRVCDQVDDAIGNLAPIGDLTIPIGIINLWGYELCHEGKEGGRMDLQDVCEFVKRKGLQPATPLQVAALVCTEQEQPPPEHVLIGIHDNRVLSISHEEDGIRHALVSDWSELRRSILQDDFKLLVAVTAYSE